MFSIWMKQNYMMIWYFKLHVHKLDFCFVLLLHDNKFSIDVWFKKWRKKESEGREEKKG